MAQSYNDAYKNGKLKFWRIGVPILVMTAVIPWILSQFLQVKFDAHHAQHNVVRGLDRKYQMPRTELDLDTELERLNPRIGDLNSWKQVTLVRKEETD